MTLLRATGKWICGILFCLAFLAFLAVATLYQASGRVSAEQTISAMSRPVLGDPELKGALYLHAPDFAALLESPDFAATVYRDPEALTAAVDAIDGDASEDAGSIREQLGLYSFLMKLPSSATRDSLLPVLGILASLSVLLGAGVVAFGRGLGRLTGVGACLAAVTWPLYALLRFVRPAELLDGSGGSTDGAASYADVARPLLLSLHEEALTVSSLFAVLSLLLFIGAAIAFIARR